MHPTLPLWRVTALTTAHSIHLICVVVWVGGILFNLIVGVPLLRSRVKSIREFSDWMADEGTRIAPWLYATILLTFVSGWVVGVLAPREATYGQPINFSYFIVYKHLLLFGMLACHLHGTLRIWPRIFMAGESEIGPLFKKYGFAAALSALLGLGAIVFSAYWSFASA